MAFARQDARFARPEAVKRDLAPVLSYFVDAHDAGDQQCDGVDAVAFDEDVATSGQAGHRCGASKFLAHRRFGVLQDRDMASEAVEFSGGDHGGKIVI